MATPVGPQGSAIFNLHAGYRLAVGADAEIFLHLTTPASANVDLSIYGSFVGAGRRERNEVLTTPPLFQVDATLTSGGTDGLLTMSIDGTKLGQDTPARGYYDLFGVRTSDSAKVLLVTGRWECVGGTVDPVTPAAD